MSIDQADQAALLLGLRPKADAARSELTGIRRDLAGLQPVEWRSPAARSVADVLQELRNRLSVAEAALDDGVRLLGSVT